MVECVTRNDTSVSEKPGNPEMIRVAVLIPIHNGLSYTKKTLSWLEHSLETARKPNTILDVVVIDDGSTDGSAEFIRKNYPAIHLLHADGDLWWSGSINMGARYALNTLQADWLVLWNNDIQCNDDYFECLLARLANHDPRCLIGSKLYFLDPPDTLFSMGCLFDPKTARSVLIGSREKDSEKFAEPRHVDWVGGMGTVIHRYVVTCIGYWDDRWFPQYAGDADYCLRAKRAGFSITVYPDLKIRNDTSSSGLPHGDRFDLFFRSFVDKKSWFNVRTQILWVWRFAESPRGWFHLLKIYAGYIGGFFFWKIMSLFGFSRNKENRKQDSLPMELVYMLLGLRLFLYNKLINRLPFAVLRRPLQKLYLTIGQGSNILPGVEFLYTGLDREKIRIGNHSVVGTDGLLDGRVGRIEIGDNVDIARECCLFTLQHDPHSDNHDVRGGDVIIEDHVWLAARVTVLPGVTIGRGAVVATNAVVTRDVEPMAIVAGVPAQKIGVRKSKLDYVINHFPYFC